MPSMMVCPTSGCPQQKISPERQLAKSCTCRDGKQCRYKWQYMPREAVHELSQLEGVLCIVRDCQVGKAPENWTYLTKKDRLELQHSRNC